LSWKSAAFRPPCPRTHGLATIARSAVGRLAPAATSAGQPASLQPLSLQPESRSIRPFPSRSVRILLWSGWWWYVARAARVGR
jgi:hypothetical protein